MKISWKDYLPVFYVYIFSFLITLNLTFYYTLVLRPSILYFLGFFSFIFAVLKIINLKGFVESFSEYDFISKKIIYYAYAFPFLELFFGLTFILLYENTVLTALCFIFYFLNLISVVRALFKKKSFVCACLGGLFNIPLSYISLLENITMLIGIIYLFIIR